MKNNPTIQLLIILIIIFLPGMVHAQPGFNDDTTDVPIDGGLSLLLAAGVGFFAKTVRDKRK